MERALVACSLWLHVGFIGTLAGAAGLVQLFDGKTQSSLALTLAFSGVVLGAMSWRRARTTLEHAEPTSDVAPDAPIESALRATSEQTGCGTIAAVSHILPQSNRRRDDDRRYPTPQ